MDLGLNLNHALLDRRAACTKGYNTLIFSLSQVQISFYFVPSYSFPPFYEQGFLDSNVFGLLPLKEVNRRKKLPLDQLAELFPSKSEGFRRLFLLR